jgi:Zn-dependent M28 family amino/carboxypeptidase
MGIYKGELYPGANDNASGVACVLEVVRRLMAEALAGVRPVSNVAVAFWGAEEMGFLGSSYFVAKPTIPLKNIQAVINYDSVANGGKEDFILWSAQNGFLAETVREAAHSHGASIERVPGYGHASDERPFSQAGVPAVTLLSKQWLNENHTPHDDLSRINQEKLNLACDILYDIIKKLAY